MTIPLTVTNPSPTTSGGTKDCQGCPAFLRAGDPQTNVLGASLNGSVCGKKIIPIGRPGTSDPSITRVMASTCPDHGEPVTWDSRAKDGLILFEVAFPESVPTVTDTDRKPLACSGCKHFIPSAAMNTKSGWQAPFCRAKGALLMPDRLVRYPATCSYADTTTSPISPTNASGADHITIRFLPEFQANFGRIDPLELVRSTIQRNREVLPEDHPTDKPITKAYYDQGVKAWRRVYDPEGFGPPVLIPVYDYKRMLPEDQWHRVPRTGDDEHPEDYVDYLGLVYALSALWRMEETPALWGAPGLGKTELYRHLAWLMCLPFSRIQITENSDIDDIFGKMLFTPEEGTHFHYGSIPKAWMSPCVMCIDEPNLGPPAVWQRIRPLTDNSKQLVMDLNKDELLTRNPMCYPGLAMNPAWDARNVGAMGIADADGRRLAHIEVTLPPDEIEREIIFRALLRDGWAEEQAKVTVNLVMQIAGDLRKHSDNGVIPVTWGTAQQIKAARNMRYFKPERAYRIAAADMLEPVARDAILDSVRSFVG